MEENRKLSIITPVYNPPLQLLNKFISSIQENSYQDFEVIFVHDFFCDEIKNRLNEICGEDPRFKVIHNQTRLATYTNRFIGFDQQMGYYISFPDSDDFIDKEYYTSLINQLEEKKADFILQRSRDFNFNTKTISEREQNITDLVFSRLSIKERFWDTYNGDWLKGVQLYKTVKRGFDQLEFSHDFYITNCEDYVQFFSLLDSDRIIISQDIKNLYNYVNFNTDSQSNVFTKSDLDVKLRAITTYNSISVGKQLLKSNNIELKDVNLDDGYDIKKYIAPQLKYNKNIVDYENLMRYIHTIDIGNQIYKIPQAVHTVWLGQSMPEVYKQFHDNGVKLNPNFVFTKFADEHFKQHPWVQSCIKNKKYAFASDYIRLWVLYHIGGIYCDTDVEFIKPFPSEVMEKDLLLCYENDDLIVQAGIIGSRVGHPLIKEVLDWYEDKEYGDYLSQLKFDIKGNKILGYTICNLVSSIVHNHPEYVKLIYKNEYFVAGHYMPNQPYKQTDNTITKHHYERLPGKVYWYEEPKDINLSVFGFRK